MSDASPHTRIGIEVRISRERASILEIYARLDQRRLCTPVTPSEHDPAVSWSAKDHLVHLALVENDWVDIIRRFLGGDPEPVPFFLDEEGRERPMPEVVAAVHRFTHEWWERHRDVSLDEAVAITAAARSRTLQLLSELSGEQLGLRVPRAPWGDGTIGGILDRNADHYRNHFNWVREGWHAQGMEWAGEPAL